ncbi:hypothetical protein H9P43_006503 [Blastocladiella emersonii ATCC 22665]|nr:hypothetical protein H9P43_006503 [Blastocladiella emersonii ATCC 22665]
MHLVAATGLSLALGAHGLRKRSLAPSGAAAGVAVGLATFSRADPVFGAVLLAFYLSGSRVTKIGKAHKAKIEEGYHSEGNRDVWQVLCTAATGTAITVAHSYLAAAAGDACAAWDRALAAAYLAHYACCAGDTFASEIGTAFPSTKLPVLITTGQRVPHGTNGGLTPIGTLASVAGGALMGLTAAGVAWMWPAEACAGSAAWFTATPAWQLVALGGVFGFAGSMLDSLLGAMVQATYYDEERKCIAKRPGPKTKLVSGHALLNNEAVNFASSLLTAVAAGAYYFWWY